MVQLNDTVEHCIFSLAQVIMIVHFPFNMVQLILTPKPVLQVTHASQHSDLQDWRCEYWGAWGPEFNPRPGPVGIQFLYKLGQPPKTISYFYCHPNIGRDYFEEFHIYLKLSFMLCVLSAYAKSSPSYVS